MIYEVISDKALPSVASAAAIFSDMPSNANGVILTLEGASLRLRGRGGSYLPTAGANGRLIRPGVRPLAIDSTLGPLIRAIQDGGTATGWIEYIHASADIMAALAMGSETTDTVASDALDDVIASLADPPGFLYKHITTAAPTNYACKTGAGILYSVSINKHVNAAVITIYDGTDATGAVIAVCTLGTVAADVPALTMQTVLYDVEFNDGLFIVASGAAADWTVAYR